MKFSKLLAFTTALFIVSLLPFPASAKETETVFFDDFDGTKLDVKKWNIAEKNGAVLSNLMANKWITTAA